MAIFIPNSILDTLLCNSCYKFLSVTPVMVFPNRKIKCGRCVTNEDTAGTISMYNTIADRNLFKCINRFDGCQELLSTSQVVRHEETCKPKYYNCPVCGEGVPTYLMINHFETNHKNLLLKSNHSIIKQLDDELDLFLLYRQKDYLLFISFMSRIIPYENFLNVTFKCLLLRELRIAKTLNVNISIIFGENMIQQKFKCDTYPQSSGENELRLKINKGKLLAATFWLEGPESKVIMPLPQINICNLCSNQYNNNDKLDPLLKLYYEERNISLQNGFEKYFSNAKVLRGSTVSVTIREQKTHITFCCFICSVSIFCQKFVFVCGQYYGICSPCSEAQTLTTVEFGDVICYILFSCKWKCGKYYGRFTLWPHEKLCEKQISQHCPVESCKFKYRLFEVEQHFKEQHYQLSSPIFVLTTLFRDYYYYVELSLNCSSNKKQLVIHSHIYIFVDFIWEQSFWKIMLTCKLPNARLRAIILDKDWKFKTIIKGSGTIQHLDEIRMYCYLSNERKI